MEDLNLIPLMNTIFVLYLYNLQNNSIKTPCTLGLKKKKYHGRHINGQCNKEMF